MPRNGDTPPRPKVDAGQLWPGGVATAIVAALVALVGIGFAIGSLLNGVGARSIRRRTSTAAGYPPAVPGNGRPGSSTYPGRSDYPTRTEYPRRPY